MSAGSLHQTPLKINQETFKQIYELYWAKVYSVCIHHIEDQEIAKGMVQDIFKSIWERKDELLITTSIERYLVRSAKFKVFEYFRNNRLREEIALTPDNYCCLSENCTENEILYNNLKNKVDQLVDTLPCQCRKVFRMSREQGLTNKEIASNLLISERAVEYHITRALAKLRSNLSEYQS